MVGLSAARNERARAPYKSARTVPFINFTSIHLKALAVCGAGRTQAAAQHHVTIAVSPPDELLLQLTAATAQLARAAGPPLPSSVAGSTLCRTHRQAAWQRLGP